MLAVVFLLTGCAPVTVSSVPDGAEVYAKGRNRLIGTTPVKVNMIARDKELIVRKDGYFSKSILLSSVDPQSKTVKLKRCERVLILTEPVSAELHVEGIGRVGVTPYKMDYDQPHRTFLIKADGYASRTFSVPEDPENHITINLDRDESVRLVTRPKNAEVFDFDANHLGSTPLYIPAEEERTYIVRKDGYQSSQVTVNRETANPIVVELVREPVVLINSEPEGAHIEYQGVILGQTPFRHMILGDMKIVVKAERHYDKQIILTRKSPEAVNVQLEPMPYVTITSEPQGGMLYLSGGVELVGATPIEVLIEEDSAFELHKAGYDIKPFSLSPQSSSSVTVPLVQSIAALEKTILIDSTPSGAEVYRPGGAELIGTTPLEQRVRGERSFELQLDGYRTKIVSVATDSADSVVFALARDESARNVTVSDPLLNTPSSF
jgi:hypothetical protein